MALPSVAEREAYIRQIAAEEGIDPEVALKVARGEGLRKGVWQSRENARYGREESFGDFQLHMSRGRKGYDLGLGDLMLQNTGLDPSDPNNWREADRFALKHAAKYGWGDWSAAKKLGYTGKRKFEGIGMKPKAKTAGIDTTPTEEDTTAAFDPAATDDTEVTYAEQEDYPTEEAPPEEEDTTEEAPSKYAKGFQQLSDVGAKMMEGEQDQPFNYRPAEGPQTMEEGVAYAPTEGIPTNAYEQYNYQPEMYAEEGGDVEQYDDGDDTEPDADPDDEELQMYVLAQDGGEIDNEGFVPDPSQFIDDDADEGIDPNEFFGQVMGGA